MDKVNGGITSKLHSFTNKLEIYVSRYGFARVNQFAIEFLDGKPNAIYALRGAISDIIEYDTKEQKLAEYKNYDFSDVENGEQLNKAIAEMVVLFNDMMRTMVTIKESTDQDVIVESCRSVIEIYNIMKPLSTELLNLAFLVDVEYVRNTVLNENPYLSSGSKKRKFYSMRGNGSIAESTGIQIGQFCINKEGLIELKSGMLFQYGVYDKPVLAYIARELSDMFGDTDPNNFIDRKLRDKLTTEGEQLLKEHKLFTSGVNIGMVRQ